MSIKYNIELIEIELNRFAAVVNCAADSIGIGDDASCPTLIKVVSCSVKIKHVISGRSQPCNGMT
jgi:hypothetical protein